MASSGISACTNWSETCSSWMRTVWVLPVAALEDPVLAGGGGVEDAGGGAAAVVLEGGGDAVPDPELRPWTAALSAEQK